MIYVFSFFFLILHLQHMEVPRLGVESELKLPAYATATATATQEPSHICDLHCPLWQHQILNPLSKARDQTHILMDTSLILFQCTTMGTPRRVILIECHKPTTSAQEPHACGA